MRERGPKFTKTLKIRHFDNLGSKSDLETIQIGAPNGPESDLQKDLNGGHLELRLGAQISGTEMVDFGLGGLPILKSTFYTCFIAKSDQFNINIDVLHVFCNKNRLGGRNSSPGPPQLGFHLASVARFSSLKP